VRCGAPPAYTHLKVFKVPEHCAPLIAVFEDSYFVQGFRTLPSFAQPLAFSLTLGYLGFRNLILGVGSE
jgi:hypothetical protein